MASKPGLAYRRNRAAFEKLWQTYQPTRRSVNEFFQLEPYSDVQQRILEGQKLLVARKRTGTFVTELGNLLTIR